MNNTHSSGKSLLNYDLQCVLTDLEKKQARKARGGIAKESSMEGNIKKAKFNHAITRAWQANVR